MTTVSNTSAATTPATTETKAQTALNSNYQDFLKLLTVQLQNQDPSAPVDTNQLTQQIATLSGVEQQINSNTKLAQLISLYTTSQAGSAVSYIGKQVDASGNQIDLLSNVGTDGKSTSTAPLVYDLPAAAKSVTVTVSDSKGNVVFTSDGTKVEGRNQLLWNGSTTSGKQAPDGVYTFKVTATDVNGKAMDATTHTTGIVTAVESENGINSLSFGHFSIPLDSVQTVYTAGTNPGA